MIELNSVTSISPALTHSILAKPYNRVAPALSRDTVKNINLGRRGGIAEAAVNTKTLPRMNAAASDRKPAREVRPSMQPSVPAAPHPLKKPFLQHPVQPGQKTKLNIREGDRARLRVAFGWNVKDARCDIDASAFLLASDNRVPADEWFVFYGQPSSPDGSVRFQEDGTTDREIISIDFGRISSQIQRIVFVMTINEAIEQHLNFGMIREAWLRVLDESGYEHVSFNPGELYENITSMTLGEIYLRNGEWRFNPVGNGVNTDLAGQCAIYGVIISD